MVSQWPHSIMQKTFILNPPTRLLVKNHFLPKPSSPLLPCHIYFLSKNFRHGKVPPPFFRLGLKFLFFKSHPVDKLCEVAKLLLLWK